MKEGRESKRERKGQEGRKDTAINQPKLIDVENALVAIRGAGQWEGGSGEVGGMGELSLFK